MSSSEDSFRTRNLLRHFLFRVLQRKWNSKANGDPRVQWHLIWALNVDVVATTTMNLKCVLLSILSCQKFHDFDLFFSHNLYIYSRILKVFLAIKIFFWSLCEKRNTYDLEKKHMLTSFEFFRSAKRWICHFKNIILQRSVFKVNPCWNTFLS